MTRFNGLIQHSFALQIDKDRQPLGRTNRELVKCFELDTTGGPGFRAPRVGEPATGEDLARLASHSPLVQHDRTSVRPLHTTFLETAPGGDGYKTPLPPAFDWAAPEGKDDETNPYLEEPRLIFADVGGDGAGPAGNDFLLREVGCEREGQEISQLLLEVVAQRRSRLFGLATASRIVNVMLPNAILTPSDAGKCSKDISTGGGAWFLQPLVSFIRNDRSHRGFRHMFALTLFLVPIRGPGFRKRKMSECEIGWAVNAGWSLATTPAPDAIPRFEVRGPLPGYISRLAPLNLPWLTGPPSQDERQPDRDRCGPLTLRQVTEAIAFGVALRAARGSAPRLSHQAERQVGDEVVTSLGSARVSSLVFVDNRLTTEEIRKPPKKGLPPGRLAELMDLLTPESRTPNPWSGAEHRKYRLDRSFVDEDNYVVGVLPKNRCLIVASAEYAQKGRCGSGLMHAGSVAYMTIGAATAIGTMRAIDRELEEMKKEEPSKIAEIDGEIAADLHEIYDLDITRETYRQLYGLMRDRLGIIADYKTLQDKMKTLYRATSTTDGIDSDRRLEKLTRRIVVLSVLIVALGLITIFVEIVK